MDVKILHDEEDQIILIADEPLEEAPLEELQAVARDEAELDNGEEEEVPSNERDSGDSAEIDLECHEEALVA
jgi:hypothetical protein